MVKQFGLEIINNMGIIILFVLFLILAVLFNKFSLDTLSMISMILAVIIFSLFLSILIDTNNNSEFIRNNYDNLCTRIENKKLILDDIIIINEVNTKIKNSKDLTDNFWLGIFHSEQFDKPIIEVPDLCFRDEIEIIIK